MPGLNLGDMVPDFDAETSVGPIKFHEWIGDRCASTFLCFFGQHILRSGKSSDRTSCIRDWQERERGRCVFARAGEVGNQDTRPSLLALCYRLDVDAFASVLSPFRSAEWKRVQETSAMRIRDRLTIMLFHPPVVFLSPCYSQLGGPVLAPRRLHARVHHGAR